MSENFRRVLFIAISTVCVLCLIELPALVNVVDYGNIVGPAAGDVFLATNRGDPELLHIHPPHSHFSGAARGGNIAANFRIPSSAMALYRWDVSYDRNGFRNDVDLAHADIAVLGDSFVEETTVSAAELMTSQLAHLENKVVANLGQYGYGPLEELAVAKRYALPLQPNTIIWMFYEGNDLKDVIHYRRVISDRNRPPGYWAMYWQRSFARNALAQVYVHLKRALRPPGIKQSGLLQNYNIKKHLTYFLYSSPSLSKQELDAFNDAMQAIETVGKLCQSQGCRLIVVFIPTKFRVYHRFCQFPKESECRNWGLNDLPDRLRRALKAMSAEPEYVDLTPKLAEAVEIGIVPYYPDDDHWSPEGQRVVALAINNYLLNTAQR